MIANTILINREMQREKLQLPGLYPPLASSRITSFDDYRQWEKQKKKAYRAELQQEIEYHNKNREKSNQLKYNERAHLNTLVQSERKAESLQRSTKIKTQQKYMQENYNLMKNTSKSPRRLREQVVYKQHPFVNLVLKEQQRKEQTKNSFIYQNKLNDLQSEMKRSIKERKKLFEAEERRKYIDHVQQEFNRHEQQRRFFQNKYLRIDKSSKKNFKKEHLEFLRDQANSRRPQKNTASRIATHQLQENNETINATGGNIGLTPIHHDRKRQLETLQKSLKLFQPPRQHLESSLSMSKQYEINMGTRPRQNYEKMNTQKSYRQMSENKQVPRTERGDTRLNANSNVNSNGNAIRYKPIISELTERETRALREPKQYKQYDIIKGTEKVFVR